MSGSTDISDLVKVVGDLTGRVDDLITTLGNGKSSTATYTSYMGRTRLDIAGATAQERYENFMKDKNYYGGNRGIFGERRRLKEEAESLKKELNGLESAYSGRTKDDVYYEKALDYEQRLLNNRKELSRYSLAVGLKEAVGHIQNMGRAFSSMMDPWAKINQAASNYARSVGMSVTGMKNLQQETQKAVTSRGIALKYNMGSDELLKAQQDYLRGAGRNIRISAEEQEDLAASHSVMQGREGEFFVQYEKFGQNISSTAEYLHDMFQTASREGISFEKYSDNVAKNIRLAQTYTFRNGLKGLEDMAKKATAIRLDMQQVANFAENVSTVEGAITTGAKLQVLGGPFAQFADPLGMLNEGLNDLEGLQDRMVNMYGSLGQMNRQTGEIEISAFNKRRIKEAAQAMGVDPGAMMDSIFAKTRQNEIEAQMAGNANVQNLSPEMRELIKMIPAPKSVFPPALKMVICIPSGITEVEERAVRDSAEQAGAREVRLIHEPMAAAIGIGLNVLEPHGNMIVDIGGGTSEIAVIALGGIVSNKSIRIAGDEFNQDIKEYMRKRHNISIGDYTAERIKIEVGAALPELENPPEDFAVQGRDLLTGIPKEIVVNYAEIAQALDRSILKIEAAVLNALEMTPPELSADIFKTGIYLAGGGSLLRGLDKRIAAKTKLPVHLAEDPLRAVARGTGIALKNFDKFTFLIK